MARKGEKKGKYQSDKKGDKKVTKKGDIYDSFSDVGQIRVYRRADFQSGSRVLKKVF